ncbi:hypothetical protein ECMP0210175_1889 [Escherichia coli MP021017.5]|nr:hypothetical protein ECMP0210179_1839 [Escherichia coli MP021017.9]EMU81521.1 hypothetical protein ECMP0210176_1940 [Escherichia coli MP021017.6]EMU83790.1 hypothetical protein ECMP0210175_1889 [Escherichia coli MP021017.5]EMU94694.1 hypothetical protein ECMP0210174_1803 [Escherichia coli MP021017.4]EMU96098.1 hypothetical protein ECMP0210173_1889 [Escherichia coli MP021017.3]EMU99690.1 hypothetical protein ECMP0210172_1857 [Escherichia coli MP021017.2]EMV06935.1 hypothetical protein ECMP0
MLTSVWTTWLLNTASNSTCEVKNGAHCAPFFFVCRLPLLRRA